MTAPEDQVDPHLPPMIKDERPSWDARWREAMTDVRDLLGELEPSWQIKYWLGYLEAVERHVADYAAQPATKGDA